MKYIILQPRILICLLMACIACQEEDLKNQLAFPDRQLLPTIEERRITFVFDPADREDGRHLLGVNPYTGSKIYVLLKEESVSGFMGITNGGDPIPAHKPSNGHRNPKVLLMEKCPDGATPFEYGIYTNPDRGNITYWRCNPGDLTIQVEVDPAY